MLRMIPLLLVLAVSTGCATVAVSPQASVQQDSAAQLAADGRHRESARAWADAEAMKEKGVKTVLAADANRARAAERLAAAQAKLGEARVAIARTLQDAPAEQLAQPAALIPVEAEVLPPASAEKAALPVSTSTEPQSALDRALLGGPDGDRP